MRKKASWFAEHPVWTGIIIMLIIWFFFKGSKTLSCEEETFFVDSSIGCFSKCQLKCSDEGYGFDGNEGFTSYYYYPDADYPDNELRRCECWCSSEGC